MACFLNIKAFAVMTMVGIFGIATTARAQTWVQIWSDEGVAPSGAPNNGPDPTKWMYDNPTAGSSNQELEIYCGAAGAGQTGNCSNYLQNAHYDGAGNLLISALPVNGQWTSGRLITHGKRTFTYGKVEFRAKLPFGAGI